MTLKTLFTRERARQLLRPATTLLMVAAALWACRGLWDHYELAPWTRDGRVRANVVQMAPDVSGLVTAVPVQDNQPVHAGDVLFEVDHAHYALALREAEAALRVAQAAYRYGERGILDVLDAQRLLQSVRSDLLDARYTVFGAVVGGEDVVEQLVPWDVIRRVRIWDGVTMSQ